MIWKRTKNCRVAAKELGVNLPGAKRHAANVRHAVARAVAVVRRTEHLVKQNQRSVLVVSHRATLDLRGNLKRLGIHSRSVSPGQHENLDRLLQGTKAILVADLDRQLSPLSFWTFQHGKKRSAVWQFERHLKSTRAERKAADDATAVALPVAETDAINDAEHESRRNKSHVPAAFSYVGWTFMSVA